MEKGNILFSPCGLNCGLCVMRCSGSCGGCGRGSLPCGISRCAREHGIDYCFNCGEFPCARLSRACGNDTFITHRNQISDLEKAKRVGIGAYLTEQKRKTAVLELMLKQYDSGADGRFYCLAVNLLGADETQALIDEMYPLLSRLTLNERAKMLKQRLTGIAEAQGIELKLRR